MSGTPRPRAPGCSPRSSGHWPKVLLLLLPAGVASGEPHIALREGLKCSTCHVNPTGGGLRNGYGALFTQTSVTPLLREMSRRSPDFSGDLGSSVTLGGDLVVANRSQLPVEGEGARNSFVVDSGNLYIQARLIPGRLSLYIDESVAPGGASNREALVLVEGIGAAGYLKAGRLVPPFGIRLADDEAFVRQVTGFNFDNQDLGVELGLEPGPLSLAVAVTNGSGGTIDENLGKQVVVSGSFWTEAAVLGASAAYNDSRGVRRIVVGPFASAHLGAVTLTGEIDLIRDKVRDQGRDDRGQVVGFASLDYWYRDAIDFQLAFDYHDPYDDFGEDERSRLSLGLEAFLTPFLSASAFYRFKDSVPQDGPGNADVHVVSLRTFF